jgi:2,4-diketo-3-deoxy-L-fuconate hydrolase
MKLVTFKSNGSIGISDFRIGVLDDNDILDLTSLVSSAGLTSTDLLSCFDVESGFLERVRNLDKESLQKVSRSEIKICPPVPRPGKVICIGLNYRDHAAESGMALPKSPVIFSKFSSCVIGPNDPILIPEGSGETDYEAELAVVIGRRAKNVPGHEALNYVFGYTNFNDVSARDFQFADGQWQRGKSCDTFAPMGEYIVTTDAIPDPQNLRIQFRLNGETLQDSSTAQMVFGVAELVEFLSRYLVLEPGDVIATGTPPGVGFAQKPPVYLKEGDVAEVEIEGLGVLSNPVASAAAAHRHGG